MKCYRSVVHNNDKSVVKYSIRFNFFRVMYDHLNVADFILIKQLMCYSLFLYSNVMR